MALPTPLALPRLAGICGAAMLGLALLASPAGAIQIQPVKSPGGITAWLVEAHGVPIVTMQAAFRGGAALDPAGKEGLANMVSGLLDEGAGELDSQAYQRKLEDLSIRLDIDAGRDDFWVGLKTLKANRDEAFRLLALALAKPRFDTDAVERIRSQIVAGLQRDADDPDYVAGKTFWKTLYPDHPYGRPVRGTAETIKGISIEDLRGFVAARLARDNLVIGVVGDITAAELGPLLDRTFGALPAHAAPAQVPDAAPAATGKVVTVEMDVPQSTVLFGEAGPKRRDPDWYAAEVVSHILGGGMTSRLYQDVREAHGLAYSVGVGLAPLDHSGLIQGGVGTANARVMESIARIRADVGRMRDDGPSAGELAAAKTYLTGSFPLRFDNTSHTARLLVAIQLERLGIDYIDKHDSLIDRVTLDEARRVAKSLYDPDRLTFIVVGKPGSTAPTKGRPEKGEPNKPGSGKGKPS